MPLNGHSYLVNQGWTGTGTGLRPGAMSRPLTIPQKRTLAGVGKDRDEAFPFWDHLFAAAATAIQIDISSDEEDEDGTTGTSTPAFELKRTSTGILSNRRPATGTPATSGTSTPASALASGSGSSTPRLTLMSIAKREAAKRGLYSRFFRGPVIGPDDVETQMVKSEIIVVAVQQQEIAQEVRADEGVKMTKESNKMKKRQADEGSRDVEDVEKAERKRWKKDLKGAEKRERKPKEKRATNVQEGDDDVEMDDVSNITLVVKQTKEKLGKMEREERKKKKRRRDVAVEPGGDSRSMSSSSPPMETARRAEDVEAVVPFRKSDEPAKAGRTTSSKKKRKRSDEEHYQ